MVGLGSPRWCSCVSLQLRHPGIGIHLPHSILASVGLGSCTQTVQSYWELLELVKDSVADLSGLNSSPSRGGFNVSQISQTTNVKNCCCHSYKKYLLLWLQ